ncbi:TPA: hypothetical protein GE143_21625 [Escherichia coli]|nr:hypothetical protein [Escherichia coli]THL39300.1 hypothetical protein FAM11_20485 [Escherichia coli K-12]EEV7807388.1 hypothetical protein [Escherichia coli]EFB3472619.1 hypothetical protein [Escherichia coli]EFC2071301.1 hypothetical protein [Escherichia coli]
MLNASTISATGILFVILFPKNVDVHYIDVNASSSIEKGNNDSWRSQHWSYSVLLSFVIFPGVNISGNSSNLLNQ